jgi:hypothetical protein
MWKVGGEERHGSVQTRDENLTEQVGKQNGVRVKVVGRKNKCLSSPPPF